MAAHRAKGAHKAPLSTSKKLMATSLVVAGAAAIAGSGVYASWTSTAGQGATLTSATVTSSFANNGTNTFATPVGNMVPGDFLYRYADLHNSGSVGQSFVLATKGVGGVDDLTGATDGLQVQLLGCSAAWVNDACGDVGGPTTPQSLAYITDAGTASSAFTLPAGAHLYVQAKLVLPSDASSSFAGKTDTITITETGTAAAGGDRSAG